MKDVRPHLVALVLAAALAAGGCDRRKPSTPQPLPSAGGPAASVAVPAGR